MAQYDLIIIGSGPAGEVGAIRAAQLGLKVAIVEKREHLGGTCLNVGCIPTKALLESAKIYAKLQHVEDFGFKIGTPEYDWKKIQERKDKIVDQQRKGLLFLMKKNKIDVLGGHARCVSKTAVSVTDSEGKTTTHDTKSILLCTGSRVRELPFAKSDGKLILNSDSVLGIDHVPKTMAIIGGGIVGMEFASCFGRFGTKVTVIELGPTIIPSEDAECVKEFSKYIKKQNVTMLTNTKLTKLEAKKDHVLVTWEGGSPEKFDRVLVSIGRAPVTDDIGLEKLGITMDGPFVNVNEHYQTNFANIYAVGDILKTPALAHTASAEAMHAVEVIAGHHPPVINYEANPSAVYTYPELASIGMTEEVLKAKKIEYKSAKFPFAPLAKAKIEDATEGFIKILFEPKYREILGVHIIGAKATELIAEFALGKILETTVDEIGLTIHPHPTMSETIMEAAHAAIGGAIHM